MMLLLKPLLSLVLLTLVHQTFAAFPSGKGGELPSKRLPRLIKPPPPLSSRTPAPVPSEPKKAPTPVPSEPKKAPAPLDGKNWIIAETTKDDFNEPGFPNSQPVPKSLSSKKYFRSLTYFIRVPIELPSTSSGSSKYDVTKLQFDPLEVNVSFEGANWIVRLDVEKQLVGPMFRVRLILKETAQESLHVAIEAQVRVNANSYGAGEPESRLTSTEHILLAERFSLRTNPSSHPVQLAYLQYLYPKEHGQTHRYTYLIFRMFRIDDEKSSSSLPRVGSMPSAPGPSQREVFGLVGMYNRTTSCFMNVILEVLASLRGISYEILGITKPGVWLYRVQIILRELLTMDNPCTAEKYFRIKNQSDAHQFYMDVRNDGLNDTAGTQEALRWNDLIVGTSFTIISRPTGEFYSATKNEFVEIVIPIGLGVFELWDALKGLYQDQQFTDDNYLIDGSRTKAPFQTRLVHLPDVLMVRLDRIDFKKGTVKLNDYMSFTETIDFKNYMLTPEEASKFAIEEPVDKDTRFSLHAVVVHRGGAQTGHYYLYIRNPKKPTEWLTINNERVEPALASTVFKGITGGVFPDGRVSSANAFLLFYIRATEVERVVNGTGLIPKFVPLPLSSSNLSSSILPPLIKFLIQPPPRQVPRVQVQVSRVQVQVPRVQVQVPRVQVRMALHLFQNILKVSLRLRLIPLLLTQ